MKDYYKSKGEKYETSWSSSLILNIDDASALAQYFRGRWLQGQIYFTDHNKWWHTYLQFCRMP
jgi:hypothetical protein